MINKKTILIPVTLIIIFMAGVVYGVFSGHYHTFPYQQIIDLRHWALNIETKEPPYGNIRIIDSALQRLLMTSIEVEEDHSDHLFVRGGAIAGSDHLLFINTNRNDEKKGHLIIFDVENYHRIDAKGLSIPMNVDELMNSSIMDIEEFPLFRFRVNGIHVEKTGESEHTLFVTHNYYHPDEKCISYNISRTSVYIDNYSLQQLSEWTTIFTASPCIYPEEDINSIYPVFPGQMSGGSMAAYDDDHLLVTVGSFHRDGIKFEALPMDTSSTFGKILLLNKHTGDYSIYATGLRNSQGLLIDSRERIWVTDHGPQGGDELNLIKEGKNYGWPEVSYGIEYSNMPWLHTEHQGSHDNFEVPAFAWLPSIAPTNLIEITGEEKFKIWSGDLMIGSLRDHSLHRLRIEGERQVTYNEKIHINHRIRDLTILKDGKIALITDEGLLMILDDGGPIYERIGPEVEARITELGLFQQLSDGLGKSELIDRTVTEQSIFMQHCSNCHYLHEMNNIGPHLNRIFDRNIGDLDDFNYSSALMHKNERWTPELMRSFLLHPHLEFSNTTMPQVPLTESEVNSIIQFLQN